VDKELKTLSAKIGGLLSENGWTISTAESCTGGLLSHVLTGVSGSSNTFIGGVVAYSNRIKENVLGVESKTLEQYGAVSQATALEMAAGIREKFNTDVGLSTTGIAGPTGGTPEKPVGLVWMGISTPAGTRAFEGHFSGGRDGVKNSTVCEILTQLISVLTSKDD